jgi:hypothetical protein
VGALSRTRLWAVILAGALASTAGLGRAQVQFPAPGSTPSDPQGVFSREHTANSDEPYATREIQERQFKRLRQEHQQELIDDTARLVKLATALKAEVDKGDQATLPTDLLKQADEINKLAKKVSERIRTQ